MDEKKITALEIELLGSIYDSEYHSNEGRDKIGVPVWSGEDYLGTKNVSGKIFGGVMSSLVKKGLVIERPAEIINKGSREKYPPTVALTEKGYEVYVTNNGGK